VFECCWNYACTYSFCNSMGFPRHCFIKKLNIIFFSPLSRFSPTFIYLGVKYYEMEFFFTALIIIIISFSLSYISRKRNKWDVENCKDENAFKNILIRPFTKKMWWITDFMRGHSHLTSSQGHIWEQFQFFPSPSILT